MIWSNPLSKNTKERKPLSEGEEFIFIAEGDLEGLYDLRDGHGFIIIDESGDFSRAYRIISHSQPNTLVTKFVSKVKRGEAFTDLDLEGDIIDRSATIQKMVSKHVEFPAQTGNMCSSCGGFLLRTGKCETCQSCGSTTGCG